MASGSSGGGLSSGSSGAAYSGGGSSSSSSGSSSARSSQSFTDSASEAERKRLEELMRAQVAAQAAQAAAQAQAEAATSLTAQTPTQMTLTPQTPANPLTLQTPVQMTMPRMETPAPAAPTLTRDEAAPIPNPFSREGVFQAAEAYRNLPANATPAQRAEAMGNYRGELQTKFGTPARRAYDQQMGEREGRIAVEAEQSGRNPADAVQYYRSLTPDQQAQRYYSLWTSKTGPGITENVPSLRQEAIVKAKINDAARIDRNLSAAIRDARGGGVDEKGRRTKPDREEIARLEKERDDLRVKEHLVDPANPTAGLNRDYAERARRNDLLSDAARLTSVAKAERALTEQAKPKRAEPERSSEQARQQLTDQAEQARREREAWLEQLRQRTATYYSHYV